MSQKSGQSDSSSERLVRTFAERPESNIPPRKRSVSRSMACAATFVAELLPVRGDCESLYYSWSKEFLNAGKRRLSGDTAHPATSSEVKDLQRQAQELKEMLPNRRWSFRCLRADGQA